MEPATFSLLGAVPTCLPGAIDRFGSCQTQLSEGLEGSQPGLDPLDLPVFDAGTHREGVAAVLTHPQPSQV